MKWLKCFILMFFCLLINISNCLAKIEPGDSYSFKHRDLKAHLGDEVSFDELYTMTGVKEITSETFEVVEGKDVIEIDNTNRKIKTLKIGDARFNGRINFTYLDGQKSFQEATYSISVRKYVPPEEFAKLTAFAHVEDYGDMSSKSGSRILIGTTGEAKRMEAFVLNTDDPNLGISYEGHIQDIGWQGSVTNGQLAGTRGQSKRIECFKITLTGNHSEFYDVYYRTHVQEYGWLDWAKNGQSAGTSNHCFRCEAIEIALVEKDSGVPDNGSTYIPAIEAYDREEGDNMYLVNMLRKSEGKPFLTGHPEIHDTAEHRVQELYIYSHTRPDGRPWFSMKDELYPNSYIVPRGENIAAQITYFNLPTIFFNMWKESPGHHANMVDDNTKYMGYAQVGDIGGPYLTYGTQFFANSYK